MTLNRTWLVLLLTGLGGIPLAGAPGCGDDAGGSSGGGTGGAAASGTAEGSGGSPGSVTIACGDQTCSYCCNDGACADEDRACDEGATEGGRVILRCDGREDCTGDDFCCAGSPAGSFAIRAECQSLEVCQGLSEPIYFCHEAAECGDFFQCVPFDLADGVKVCDPV